VRKAALKRESLESNVYVSLNLDGKGQHKIQTGVGFFDHMLELFAFHSQIDLEVEAKGDLRVDDHHTIEDVGIVLGQALKQALGDRLGINRYGFFLLPMDETLARAVVDISGRPTLVFKAEFTQEKAGDMSTEMVREFFYALSIWARLTLHLEILYGKNNHHMIEALFKCFGQALRLAIKKDGDLIPSTKGLLD